MQPKKKNKPKDKRVLCFGTRRGRFDGMKQPRDYPGPFEHFYEHSLLKKGPNKTGYTLLASKTPRDKDFRAKSGTIAPPLGTYDIEPYKPPKQQAKPFGSGTKIGTEITWLTPPPGAHSFFKRKVRVCTAFGRGPRITVPLVKIHCGQFNMSRCVVCGETPVGDYWHRNSPSHDLCRPCMEKEVAELKKCSTCVMVRFRKNKELENYHLMRHCEFYHDHHNTKAAVQVMPTRYLNFKLQKENYLGSYGVK